MEPRKKYTTGTRQKNSPGEMGSPVGIRGIRAKSRLPPSSTKMSTMSTFRREPTRSLTMPQKATEAMEKIEVRAFSTPSCEAENPACCR